LVAVHSNFRPQSGQVVRSVKTRTHVAQIIREDEQLLWDFAINMEPEDGCLWVYGTDEQHTMAFTIAGWNICRN
jgi:hypothetical protein